MRQIEIRANGSTCTEGAFNSEGGSKRSLLVRTGEAEDSDSYAEGSSGEDDIDTEDGSGRARFQYIRRAVVERTVQEIA